MKCQVCKVKEAEPHKIVCSDNCNNIRLMIRKLSDIYTPTNGCDNCWGDLGQGCTTKCKDEFKKAHIFVKEMYSLVRMAFDDSKCSD